MGVYGCPCVVVVDEGRRKEGGEGDKDSPRPLRCYVRKIGNEGWVLVHAGGLGPSIAEMTIHLLNPFVRRPGQPVGLEDAHMHVLLVLG